MTSRGLTGLVLTTLACADCGGAVAHRDRHPGPRLTPRLAQRLDTRFRREVAKTGIPGAVAAIVFPDGREWSAATGKAVLRPPRPMTVDSALPFDSVTKVATATLALRLTEEGRLSLDDRVARWYPEWRGDPRATVRDLLGHTAGARDPADTDPFYVRIVRHPPARVTVEQLIAHAPRPGPRTSEAQYSNVGFLIAGAILERAAGEPVAEAMRRRIFDHPGGAGLAMQPDERPRPPLAHEYWYPHGFGNPRTRSSSVPPESSRETCRRWPAGATSCSPATC